MRVGSQVAWVRVRVSEGASADAGAQASTGCMLGTTHGPAPTPGALPTGCSTPAGSRWRAGRRGSRPLRPPPPPWPPPPPRAQLRCRERQTPSRCLQGLAGTEGCRLCKHERAPPASRAAATCPSCAWHPAPITAPPHQARGGRWARWGRAPGCASANTRGARGRQGSRCTGRSRPTRCTRGPAPAGQGHASRRAGWTKGSSGGRGHRLLEAPHKSSVPRR